MTASLVTGAIFLIDIVGPDAGSVISDVIALPGRSAVTTVLSAAYWLSFVVAVLYKAATT